MIDWVLTELSSRLGMWGLLVPKNQGHSQLLRPQILSMQVHKFKESTYMSMLS